MPGHSIANDIRTMLRIAVPLALAELGWMAMSLVDNIMVGGLPDSALAIGSTSVGSALFYGVAIFGLGTMSGLDTLVSQAFGAGDWKAGRKALAAGLALALLMAPLLMLLVLAGAPLLGVIGVRPEVLKGALEFNRILLWSLPPLFVYATFRRYLRGYSLCSPGHLWADHGEPGEPVRQLAADLRQLGCSGHGDSWLGTVHCDCPDLLGAGDAGRCSAAGSGGSAWSAPGFQPHEGAAEVGASGGDHDWSGGRDL